MREKKCSTGQSFICIKVTSYKNLLANEDSNFGSMFLEFEPMIEKCTEKFTRNHSRKKSNLKDRNFLQNRKKCSLKDNKLLQNVECLECNLIWGYLKKLVKKHSRKFEKRLKESVSKNEKRYRKRKKKYFKRAFALRAKNLDLGTVCPIDIGTSSRPNISALNPYIWAQIQIIWPIRPGELTSISLFDEY